MEGREHGSGAELGNDAMSCASGASTRLWWRRAWGERGAYIVTDKHGKYVLISQRLPLIASFLNARANHSADRVSVPTLHQAIGKTQTRTGGYAKHRWRLSWCQLEEVAQHFEGLRGRFEQAVVLGAPTVYQIASGPTYCIAHVDRKHNSGGEAYCVGC